LSGDTLIQFDNYSYKDSMAVYKAIVTFEKPDRISLEYLTSDEYWILFKADVDTQDLDNDSAILKGVLSRKKDLPCIDERSDEEKKRDTIHQKIEFVF
jgi:hypothetical protein